MLKTHIMPLGAYQTNCYIIHDADSKTCCVIDPGFEPDTVLDKLDALGLTCEAILLTHGHFDHVGAVKEIAAETGCKVYLCAEDLSMPPMMTAGQLYYTNTYAEGDSLSLAGLDSSVLHTPGPCACCAKIPCSPAIPSSPDPAAAPTCPAAIGQPSLNPCAVWLLSKPTSGSIPATANRPI